jgi:hypothetical protein
MLKLGNLMLVLATLLVPLVVGFILLLLHAGYRLATVCGVMMLFIGGFLASGLNASLWKEMAVAAMVIESLVAYLVKVSTGGQFFITNDTSKDSGILWAWLLMANLWIYLPWLSGYLSECFIRRLVK